MMIPAPVIIAMSLSALGGLALFLGLLIFCKKRFGVLRPFWFGCGTFLLFALVLESIVHRAVLTSVPAILENTWLYALYGGLMAGLFEECGRFFCMRILKKKHNCPQTALVYGAGHGGIEVVMTLVSTMGTYLTISILNNAGQLDMVLGTMDDPNREALMTILAQLAASPAPFQLLGLLERISAVILHISLSVFVWQAVQGRLGMLPAAIALHALFDIVAVILSRSGVNTVLLELLLLALSLCAAYAAKRIYQEAM